MEHSKHSIKGDKWNFGQVGYKGDSKSYKVGVILQQIT